MMSSAKKMKCVDYRKAEKLAYLLALHYNVDRVPSVQPGIMLPNVHVLLDFSPANLMDSPDANKSTVWKMTTALLTSTATDSPTLV